MTSFLFPEGKFSLERLKSLSDAIGKDKLVVDLRLVVALNPLSLSQTWLAVVVVGPNGEWP